MDVDRRSFLAAASALIAGAIWSDGKPVVSGETLAMSETLARPSRQSKKIDLDGDGAAIVIQVEFNVAPSGPVEIYVTPDKSVRNLKNMQYVGACLTEGPHHFMFIPIPGGTLVFVNQETSAIEYDKPEVIITPIGYQFQ